MILRLSKVQSGMGNRLWKSDPGGSWFRVRDLVCTFKQNKVRGNLIRIGGFAPELIDRIMLPVVGMKEPYRYRNKAQFPIGADKDGNPVAGFYAARTHSIIPVNDCKLGDG